MGCKLSRWAEKFAKHKFAKIYAKAEFAAELAEFKRNWPKNTAELAELAFFGKERKAERNSPFEIAETPGPKARALSLAVCVLTLSASPATFRLLRGVPRHFVANPLSHTRGHWGLSQVKYAEEIEKKNRHSER